jgi:hypothetical protein
VAEEVRDQQIVQAVADLNEIANDALEDLQQVEPDGHLERDHGGAMITMSTGGIRLRIDVWEQGAYGLPGDSMVLACAVLITNRRYDTELNAANLVYEQIGDRLGWQVYRFRAGMVPPDKYTFGPFGRTHGLSYVDFFGRWGRHFMIHTALHAWQKAVVQLTSETLLDLFREAVDLRPPDRRTGIWPQA